MIGTLFVQHSVLQSQISDPHDVIQNHHCQGEMLHFLWRQINGQQEASEVVGQDAECVFDDAPCPRQTLVEDPLFICHIADGEGLHHPFTQRESVVADHEVSNGCVVTGKWSGRWQDKGPVLQLVPQL